MVKLISNFVPECTHILQCSPENNRVLRIQLRGTDLVNPRTGNTYKSEAEDMFAALAAILHFIKNDCADTSLQICEGVITSVGFNDVQIHSGEIQELGVYNRKD